MIGQLRALLVSISFLSLCSVGFAQNAQVQGQVSDSSGAVIPKALVRVVNQLTGTERKVQTNGSGQYSVPGLDPSVYKIFVQASGFSSAVSTPITLNVTQNAVLDFKMQVGSEGTSITVDGSGVNVNTTDGSVSTVIDRQFVENIPLNGRSLQSLIALSPGVTATPGASVGYSGEFSVNGQRTESNIYSVDGVSANTGTAAGVGLTGNGSTPGETALGTTQSLVSVDALQEFRINTSTYSAEYGRSPGAQISFQTRSGTNDLHGSVFNYFRNDALDANNWFNSHAGISKTAERQNDFGGVFGGPVRIPGLYNGKDKTFFFFAYEGLRLAIPQPALTLDVPDNYVRQNAPAALQPTLNAFPIQNGAEQGDGLALFTGATSTPSSLDATSIRIDHSFGSKLTVFGRYSDSPSNTTSTASWNLANLDTVTSSVKTLTIGANSGLSHLANEFRFGYTDNSNSSIATQGSYGGAKPLTVSDVTPGLASQPNADVLVCICSGTYPHVDVGHDKASQHQWNIIDSISTAIGRHALKYGVDYRKATTYGGTSNFFSEAYFEADAPTNTTMQQNILDNSSSGYTQAQAVSPVGTFQNFSAYVQDEWKATSRLHLSLGLRWDLNPTPKNDNGPQPYTVTDFDNFVNPQLAPAGTPIYKTDYRGFAPRVGAAYQLRTDAGHETVMRAGFGVFYDLGNATALGGLSNAVGFSSTLNFNYTAFPLTAAQNTLPAPSIAPPYNSFVIAFAPDLSLPYTLQWNVAVEQGLGVNQTLTASYVASQGKKLLNESYYLPSGPNWVEEDSFEVYGNGSYSKYSSLQLEFRRRLSSGLQALGSYTWAHSIDNASVGASILVPLAGNSNFDVRNTFTSALTYEVPGQYSNAFLNGLLQHWSVDIKEVANSALPVNIVDGYTQFSNNLLAPTQPDIVPGVPFYVRDPNAAGKRSINIAAFTAGPPGVNGDAPRNFLRSFATYQTDLAIRREFPLREHLRAQFRAESFNMFNHPNFGNIDNSTSDGPTLFGKAQSTLNSALGGLNPLYQTGGPRSLQLALKILF